MRRPRVPVAWLMSVLITTALPAVAAAGSTSWSYSNYSNGGYVPLSGTFQKEMSGNYFTSRVSFRFDTYNRAQILDYNNGGDNPGTRCDYARAYVTLDQTLLPATQERLDAQVIVTTLPNPKADFEDDNRDGYKEESEIVALGTVDTTTTYAMKTYWYDRRPTTGGYGGWLQAQFAMSKKGLIDYNNCYTSGAVQITNYYSGFRGRL